MSGTASAVLLQLPVKPSMPRKRGPLVPLRIDTPVQNDAIPVNLVGEAPSTSSLSSANSESSASDFLPFAAPPSTKPRSLRNLKKLALALPSAASSTTSLGIPPSEATTSASTLSPSVASDAASIAPRSRRPSAASLTTATATAALAHRREEDGGSPSVPYADGPVEIIPGIWIGSEDNAREFDQLAQRGIKAILNVAKEVTSVFDAPLEEDGLSPRQSPPSDFKYLKMHWSHGQKSLIQEGFPTAMAFVDDARERGDGVLIHCQCGISRSGTMVIALVMRAAATSSPSVPPEVWSLKGMHAAYDYVKQKSKWVGPNMSLIYQLLEYERMLRGGNSSPTPSERSSVMSDEEEWSRRRQALDEAPSDDEDRESLAVRREAEALDQAMVDRRVARKVSASSFASSTSSGGIGMGVAWKSRYGGRRRAGSHVSVTSTRTTGSVLDENLLEEEEEEELLGVGSTYGGNSIGSRSPSIHTEETPRAPPAFLNLPGRSPFTPQTARPLQTPRAVQPPPSAPATKTSFDIPPPPLTAVRATFDLPSQSTPKPKRRPAPLVSLLPPVPASPSVPVTIGKDDPIPVETPSVESTPKPKPAPVPPLAAVPRRARTQSSRPPLPPLMLRTLSNTMVPVQRPPPPSSGPSQTLFVFPPSPNNKSTRTPATLTLTSSGPLIPFPCMSPPRVATEKRHGRTRSFVALGVPPTPTTACSRVDARGFFGADV